MVNFIVGLAGFVCLGSSDGSSKDGMIGFVSGIMLLTLAAIFLFGVIIAAKGFSKRFSGEKLVAYWVIEGGKWKEFVEERKKMIFKRGGIVGASLAVMFVGVVLFMAYSRDDFEDVMQVAMISGVSIVLVFVGVMAMQLFALSGANGRVWLSTEGVLMNGVVFFRSAMGVFVRRCELVQDSDGAVLEIEYLVSSGKARAEHLLKVPVAEGEIEIVSEVTRDWAM